MKTMKIQNLLVLILLGAIPLSTSSAVVLSVTSFQETISNYDPGVGLFNEQPVADPVAGANYNQTAGFGGFFNNGQTLGIDFGASYSGLSFTDIYLAQGSYGPGTAVLEYHWSDDLTFNNGDDEVIATNLSFFTYADNASTGGGTYVGRWSHVYDGATVAVNKRYLIAHYLSGDTGNFAGELAFVNSSPIPEPSTLALGLVGLALGAVGYRRNSLRKI
jgi:hypothetical protein